MTQYEVNIVARIDTTILVNAESKEQACEIAEQEWGETYIVYNPDLKEYSDFSTIIGYEPEEVE
jgi:hypothetical protein